MGQNRLKRTDGESITRAAVRVMTHGTTAPLNQLARDAAIDPRVIVAFRESLVPVLWPFAAGALTPSLQLIEAAVAAIRSVPVADTPEGRARDLLAARLFHHIGVSGVYSDPFTGREDLPSTLRDRGEFLAKRSPLAHVESFRPRWDIDAPTIARAATLALLHGERLQAVRIMHWLQHPFFEGTKQRWCSLFLADAKRYYNVPRSRAWPRLEFEIQLLEAPRWW